MPSLAIRRPRLEQLIDDHPDQRIVLVRGPVGAGKTVLAAQWARAQPDPCIWLPVDPSDNDFHRFRVRLVAAEQELFGRAHHPSHNLVLDGVDVLNDPAVQDAIRRLVEHPPAGVRVVLVSRCKPHLGLERARLRGDLVEIDSAALRFRRDEIDALASASGASLDPAELEQTTMGWAAGLRLAQLAAWGDDLPSRGLEDSDGYASEYVREELIDGSPKRLRAFLAVTCWLPVLTGPLCAAITGQRNGERPPTLAELEALPLMPIASRPGAFRFPPILTRLLRHEYRRRDPGSANEALVQAAEACRRTGELLTAIELLLQAGRGDEAADACAELALAGEAPLRRIDEMLRREPDAAPALTPRWVPWRIRAAIAAGHVDEAVTLLEDVDRVASPGAGLAHDDPGLVVARATLAERLGDTATLLACSDRSLPPAQSATAPGAELRALGWRVRALVWSGDLPHAIAAVRALEKLAVGSPREAAVAIALARAWVAWFDGATSAAADALAGVESQAGDDQAAELALLSGLVHHERNQVAKAMLRLQEATSLAASHAHNVVAALAACATARCHRAAGAAMDALELVVSTRSASPRLPRAVDLYLRSTEARIRLEQHDIAGAQAVIRAAPPAVETQLLAVRLAVQQGSSRAAGLLESVTPATRRQVVEQRLLHAQLPGAEPPRTVADLMEAIAVGEPLGLVRTFLDEGPAVCRRLAELAMESADRAVGRIAALASQELALAPAPGSTPLIEALTTRELAVLRLLPLRMSNREMAAQMYISVNTLKTHVRAIYRKLDVPHRSAAVRRAKALQLV